MANKVYRRASDHYWWHWRPACRIWNSHALQKLRGKTLIYLTLASHPTTFTLCPGCKAEDDRVKTKDVAKFVKRDTSGYTVNRRVTQPVRATTSRY